MRAMTFLGELLTPGSRMDITLSLGPPCTLGCPRGGSLSQLSCVEPGSTLILGLILACCGRGKSANPMAHVLQMIGEDLDLIQYNQWNVLLPEGTFLTQVGIALQPSDHPSCWPAAISMATGPVQVGNSQFEEVLQAVSPASIPQWRVGDLAAFACSWWLEHMQQGRLLVDCARLDAPIAASPCHGQPMSWPDQVSQLAAVSHGPHAYLQPKMSTNCAGFARQGAASGKGSHHGAVCGSASRCMGRPHSLCTQPALPCTGGPCQIITWLQCLACAGLRGANMHAGRCVAGQQHRLRSLQDRALAINPAAM